MILKQLSIDDKEAIKDLFISVFTGEPWNDDWSDSKQLDQYIEDLCGQGYSLAFGLYDDGELIAYYEKHEYRDRETMKMYDMV